MKVLGFDPGGHTGYSIIRIEDKKIVPVDTGTIVGSAELKEKDFKTLISSVNVVVIEDFLVRPDKAKQGAFDWDRMQTPQEIAQLLTLCRIFEIPHHLQQPSIKPVGYGWAGMKYVPGKKGQHERDALAHAVYYVVKNKLARPVEKR